MLRRLRHALLPAALLATAVAADPVLDGEYKMTMVVADLMFVGPGKIAAADDGSFVGKFTFEEPYKVVYQIEGKIAGDSVTFTGTYRDETEMCTGTMNSRGTVADEGASASGVAMVLDECRGEFPLDWSLAR